MASTGRRRHAAVAIGMCAVALAALTAPIARGTVTEPLPDEPTIGPLISGERSLLHGTHVWTDYAYDDRGADSSTASADNAADLIQLQLKPGAESLSIRAVLETLTDPSVPLLGIGIDTDNNAETGAPDLPGWTVEPEGRPLGLDRLVLVDNDGAQVKEWTGSWTDVPGTTSFDIDTGTNTIDASIPYTSLGSSAGVWGVVGVLGVSSHSWFDDGGPIHDLAYVHEDTFSGQTMQSAEQAEILSGSRDASEAMQEIDLATLPTAHAPATPTAGVKNTFLYRSHLELGEGMGTQQDRKYAGPYQPYVVWFPANLPSPAPMVVYLHGAMQSHLDGSYGGSGNFVEVGPVGVGTGIIDPNAVIVTPLGRNETSLGYAGASEQDILDVIADTMRQFSIDEDKVALTGYSLGGVGTFNLAQLYPDKWAAVVEIVGAPDLGVLTIQEEQVNGAQTMPNALENLRNINFRMAHSRLDELELIVSDQPDQAFLAMQLLGYDFRYYQFYRRDHLMFPVATIQCELEKGIADGRVRDPARVTYSQEPKLSAHEESSGLDLHHDRAYWMSDMVVRGENFKPGDKGTVDITNLARPDRTPDQTPVHELSQNITQGRDVCGPNPDVQTYDTWTTLGNAWSKGDPVPTDNALDVVLTQVESVTVDLTRMSRIDRSRAVTLHVTTDGPSTISFVCGPDVVRTVEVNQDTTTAPVVC